MTVHHEIMKHSYLIENFAGQQQEQLQEWLYTALASPLIPAYWS